MTKKLEQLKILVIGLGSMGKRRIRCLKNLNIYKIYGYDVDSNRKIELSSF